MVERQLKKGVPIDGPNYPGQTPLTKAVENGNLDVVRFLVKQGAYVNASAYDDWTSFMRAARDGKLVMVRILVEYGAEVDVRNYRGMTPLMQAADGGHRDVVRFLAEHGAAVDASDSDGQTSLMKAARDGKLDVIQCLIECGAEVDIRDNRGWTPLMKAVERNQWDVLRFLLEFGADVDAIDNEGQTSLMRAAREGKLNVVRVLVDCEAHVDASDYDGRTSLVWACRYGKLNVVRYLVEHGATVDASADDDRTPPMRTASCVRMGLINFQAERIEITDSQDKLRESPLMWAACSGHLDIIRCLVEHRADVNRSRYSRWTPLIRADSCRPLDKRRIMADRGARISGYEVLNDTDRDEWASLDCAPRNNRLEMRRIRNEHRRVANVYYYIRATPLEWAACYGHLRVVRFLSKCGADIDACDSANWTPLIRAAQDGHLDMVRLLVKCEADVNASDIDGWTPLMRAAHFAQLDVVRFLIESGACVNGRSNSRWTPLMRAAYVGHLDVVRLLVEHGAAVDACDSDGWTPLMRAARDGKLDMVRILVELGATVDASDNDGRTSLMWAAEKGKLDVVRILVEHRADIDAGDSEGRTPLMWAAGDSELDVVQFLVKHGADVKTRRKDGWTPLIWAYEKGYLDMMRFLVEHGATVDICINGDWTLLMQAAVNGDFSKVRLLLECGANVDASGSAGWTPLIQVAKKGDLDIVRVLIKHGADVDGCDNEGRTSLYWAYQNGHLDVVRFLAEHGAVVNVSNSVGWTPLMRAARDGRLDVVHILVERGAAVDVHSSSGSTPLIQAAYTGNLDVVRFLVDCGVDVDGCDNEGWTPLMRAARNGKLDMVRFLVKHEANVNLMSADNSTALSIAAKSGYQEIVHFLLPLVRYQNGRIETENRNQHTTVSSHIPSGWLISPFEVEVEPSTDDKHVGGDYRGKWLDADVVVKLFVADISSASFVDEVRLWHQLRHPNILKLYGVCNSHHHLFVCEYASKGSLSDYLKVCDAECRTPWKFLYEAALGLEYLHERKIVHGHLRGSNILIGSDGLAKLAGFESSASPSGKRLYASRDWIRWTAPENLEGNKASLASDVYSLAMCIVEAVSGKVPLDEFSERFAVRRKSSVPDYIKTERHLLKLTDKQLELVLAMCCNDPRDRLNVPAIVDRLNQFVEIETAKARQYSSHLGPVPLAKLGEFNNGKTSSLWIEVQTLVDQCKNPLYHQLLQVLRLIYDTLNAESHPWSTLQRFHDLLSECRDATDAMSQQNRVCRLSATRARDNSIRGLHRRINQLLQLVRPHDHDAEMRETEWKRLSREQAEIFVSEASEACVLLSSVDSEEDRSALVAVLRAVLRNIDGTYTEKQLVVLHKVHDDILSKSLEDVQLATTPEWFIPWFELKMNENEEPLGVGGFGSVIKAKWLDSEVVVKKLEIADRDAANADKKREMRQMFEREVDIWFGLSHPHVVRLFGACHVGRPFFVCELAPNGTLDEYLRRHPDELWSKLSEAALGVQYLHARGIVHGDLKGNNILAGSDGKAKVTDFGLSGVFGDDSTETVLSGAWHWVAPECLLGEKPTFASDIYSLGMCIIEALRVTNGDEFYLPWGKLPNAAVKFHVTMKHRLPQRPSNCSNEVWTLIERMCKSDPADRMLIMTVVDGLKTLAGRQGDLSGETDQFVRDIGKKRLSSLSVADELAEMQGWKANCDTEQNWEGVVLTKIYRLLWDRLELVATQLLPDGEDTIANLTTSSNFSALLERSKQQTRAALGITDVIPLVKFTELALGGYALHRRLDKFMAAHSVPRGSRPTHEWTSACNTFMRARADPRPGCS